MKIDHDRLIQAYINGASMNTIANAFGTYPTTVKRVLEKHNIELRHDTIKKGDLLVQDGEKLIEWAKAQERLVTKAELARVLGKTKLSPSYFEKYPELGKYIASQEQRELKDYSQKLYAWLQENNIDYKPNDRTRLKVAVTALLLGDYSNIILHIAIKPRCISKEKYNQDIEIRTKRASEAKTYIILINEESFKNLDSIRDLLNTFKKK